MKLIGLTPLYRDMKGQRLDRTRFTYTHGRVNFDVFFFIDAPPYRLLFGANGYNVAFEIPVRNGFEINPILSNVDYRALCDALGIIYNPNNRFSPKAFFGAFSQHIPLTVQGNYHVRPADIIRFHSNVEEADKIYFCGWRDNTKTGKQVTEKNLEKTQKLLGMNAYKLCLNKNISSCWTDQRSKAIEIIIP